MMGVTDAILIQKKHSSDHQAGAAQICGTRTIGDAIVNQQAIPQEVRTWFLHGWLGSLVLHGLVLLAALPLFRLSPLTMPKEPFTWEVALVDSTQTVQELISNLQTPESVVSRLSEQTPLPARTIQANRHTAPTAEHIVPVEPETVEPDAATSQPLIASSTAPVQEPATAPITEKPVPLQPQASALPPPPADISTDSATADLSTSQTTASTATEARVRPSDVPPLSQSAAESHPEATSAPRPDYGWLQQAIFRKLEELKRSSQPFLDQSQLFKVMVKAVVSKEGILLDSTVVRSSGLEHIDQEAMALVQRAFPMQFDRALDRQKIVMRIPITYSRD
jgi:protein TonB